jgi:alpha-L-fucosidase
MKMKPIKDFFSVKKLIYNACIFTALLSISCNIQSKQDTVYTKVFEPEWESLMDNEIPEWLLDAKFGIYAHWGVYSVPAYRTEKYGRAMYVKGSNIHNHHTRTYGDPAEFGYKEFIPMFKAENYDPAEWVKIIKQSGARYAGFALVHHDGFCMWDSQFTRWNSMNMGPKRDLYGELVKELRDNDLKVIATEHHIRTFNWVLPWYRDFWSEPDTLMRIEYENLQWDIFDPEYGDLYWNEEAGMKYEDFIREWRNKLTEVIDKYRPDLLWFDGGAFQDETSAGDVQELLAYYYNKQNEWQKPVVVLNKLPGNLKFNFPVGLGMLTFEEGRDRQPDESLPWIDDMKISDVSWSYVEGQKYKTANEIVDGLIDRVARGGGLLLNLSPKADGTIPEEQQIVLREIGKWLEINGEAIFETRPWKIRTEGPDDKFFSGKVNEKWSFTDNCDAGDIRFTINNNSLYVMALGWPDDLKLFVKSIHGKMEEFPDHIRNVSLLGSNKKVEWSVGLEGTTFVLPEKVNDIAVVLKVELKTL